ncbi:hypothetical protein Xcel_2146 [Xylanimonas cellulosilytica DSM 15894]|uniref:Uncharacterized protein n=1 Tax=Xylanimonas cellulosilytica (strain DSM 15894 / JCM 12276 / CECT 5975 / KCTC 9989 / LMG 20990 / NBRC 107835 / XIL07) TaxID=446471 RepID=D1BUF1_XYLCX|nr:hypothetical protein [Xylanimonas cellulosilytica]ACZ31164.1 hypothetical protein Xcel_2146 [Xylanimonas cellulosilytica DSM 15894]
MWSRRPRLPDDVRERLGIGPAERTLAAGELKDGGWAVAVPASLLVARAEDPVLSRPWSDVDRASFDPRHGIVTVTWVDGAPPLRLRAVDPARSRLPQVVRERVEWSVVLGQEVPLPGGRSARVAVRRSLDGTMFSQVLAGPGVDLDDPTVAPLVDAAEQQARAQVGLPE